ncbi:Mitochondrial inner membrane protease atp23 [Malassezia sp. CBS 17886]|nr:Mitochondrial inner membrane protease atp23 [Malassezia sp. CBS 17886]
MRYPVRSVAAGDAGGKDEPTGEEESLNDLVAKQRCEQWKDDLLRTSPMVRFMVKHLALLDCNPVSPRAHAQAPAAAEEDAPPNLLIAPCPPNIAGGFSPSEPGKRASEAGILLCANRIFSKAHLEDTLAHEMIHWWDHCRFKVDWNNLQHHACSEIRAASLSGDCRWMREVNRRHYSLIKQHQVSAAMADFGCFECAKRRAILSVRANPACPDEAAAVRAVSEVWESCFYDTRPFDEIY